MIRNLVQAVVCSSSILMLACSYQASVDTSEIDSLTTVEQQANFLIELARLDQKVRLEEDSVLDAFGPEGREYEAAWRNISDTDRANSRKIEYYLQKHGYPSVKQHGVQACDAPFLIAHHSSDYDQKVRLYPFLNSAWKSGDLPGGQFTFFLNRMYRERFGRSIEWNRPFFEQEEIDTLIYELDLGER